MTHRLAVLGMGRWGAAWCGVLAGEPDAEIVAVAAGRNVDELRRSTRFSVYDDYRAALDAPGIDAVVITLPVDHHADAVAAAAERGLGVLCEKPLVARRKELLRLQEVAAVATAPVRVAQNYREREWARLVAHHLPLVGALQSVTIDFAQPEFVGGRRELMRHPLLADMSVHHLDLLRFLTADEARVRTAHSSRRADARYAGDSDLAVSLDLARGGTVEYRATWAARGRQTPWDADWQFHGENGSVRVNELAVTIDTRETSTHESTRPPREDDDLRAVWRNFARALAGDERAGVTVDDNARSLGLVLDIADIVGIDDASRTI